MQPNQKSVRDGIQDFLCPFTDMFITQGSNDTPSHMGIMAHDVRGASSGVRYLIYAPCDIVCVNTYWESGQAMYQSKEPVRFANGRIDYATFMVVHDNTMDSWIGREFSQGESFFQMGDAGYATGVHTHFQCSQSGDTSWWQNEYGIWRFNNEYDPSDCYFVDDTNIIEGYGYNWKTTKDVPVEKITPTVDEDKNKDQIKVIVPQLNVRTEPTTDSKSLGFAPEGYYNYYEIVEDKIVLKTGHILGRVPIIEYPLNSARLGAFEIVIPLLDAINEVASNRLDGIEQFIQAIMVLKGVDIDSEDFKALKENGGLKIPADGDVDYLVQELNQGHTQTVVDDLYQAVLTICGMPNRNGGSSTSDTGSAVIMRDGWSDAEARAQSTEDMFKESESEFLRLAIYICNTFAGTNLKASDVEPRFTRRNYENIQAKSQVLTGMLSNNKIHPRLAFEHCGMFIDPELAYTESMAYYEEQQQKAQEMLAKTEENTVGNTEEKESEE